MRVKNTDIENQIRAPGNRSLAAGRIKQLGRFLKTKLALAFLKGNLLLYYKVMLRIRDV